MTPITNRQAQRLPALVSGARRAQWLAAVLTAGWLLGQGVPVWGEESVAAVVPEAGQWRAQHRIIDLHQHLDYKPELLARAIKIMDASGIGLGIDLTPGTVTPGPNGEPSEFERHKKMEDTLFPGRWVQYMNLDYKNWDQPDFAQQAVQQVEEGRRLGAAGFKEWKRLGLYLRDGQGKLIGIDDPRLDPMWERIGQLNLPVSIHVADPKAFFEPYNDKNERWKELKDHRSWWFGDTNKFPTFHELLESLNRVIARHPHTTFVCLHFGNDAEELDWVAASLDRYPNMSVDLAARLPELGRHDPQQVHDMFVKYQDRILFGTDFQSLESKLILGSSGNEPPETDADAEVFFRKEYRWLETWDKNWPHMTPIQGDWTISSIGLPAAVLRKIYFDNARGLLARSLPEPILRARRTSRDFVPDGDVTRTLWQTATPVQLDCQSSDGTARPQVATELRSLWSRQFLYLRYDCPYTQLTTFQPVMENGKRAGFNKEDGSLWERDVVECFIGSDPENIRHYAELEVAPTNERLDLMLNLPDRDWQWSSHCESAVHVDETKKIWTCELRIPLGALAPAIPREGTRWRANFYRMDRAAQVGLAWRPTLQGTFHAPERFGVLEFNE
jgi:predicted TIM-barrel fold metal-dependent hydrolase